MSKIRLHGSSSGYTEIAPVAASGNNTVTLPNDGTIISKDANGAVGVTSITVGTGVTIGDGKITCDGSALTSINAANLVGVCTSGLTKTGGFGKLLQVQSTSKTGHFTPNTTTVTDITGLSVSITPSSTSSKIFIMADIFMSGSTNTYAGFRLLRDSTAIRQTTAIDGTDNRFMGTIGSHTDQDRYVRSVGLNFLDSPNSTSSVTYKIAVSSLYGSNTVHINRTGATDNLLYPQAGSSTITVMEIAA